MVDVIIASAGIATRAEGWRVLEEATLSDHQYLEFRIIWHPRTHQSYVSSATREVDGWVLRGLSRRKLIGASQDAANEEKLNKKA